MSERVWTSEPPSEAGWYWLRKNTERGRPAPLDSSGLIDGEERSVHGIPSAEELTAIRSRLDAAEKLAEAVDRLPWKGSPLGEAYTAYRSSASAGREDKRG